LNKISKKRFSLDSEHFETHIHMSEPTPIHHVPNCQRDFPTKKQGASSTKNNESLVNLISNLFSKDRFHESQVNNSKVGEVGYCHKCHIKSQKKNSSECNGESVTQIKRKIPPTLFKALHSNIGQIQESNYYKFYSKNIDITDKKEVKVYFLPHYLRREFPHLSMPSELGPSIITSKNGRKKFHCYCKVNYNSSYQPQNSNNVHESVYHVLRNIVIAPYINYKNTHKTERIQNKIHSDCNQASVKKGNTQYLDDTVNEVISILVKRKNRIQKECLCELKRTKSGEADMEKLKYSTKYYSLGDNILCMGFASSSHTNTPAHIFCPKMPPGIQCTHFNTNVSFIKTSQAMKAVQTLFGDDFIREMLLNCIVLIPTDTSDNLISEAQDSGLNKFNYIQICGPPLFSCTLETQNNKSNKRKLSQNLSSHKLRDNLSEDLVDICSTSKLKKKQKTYDPNEALPKHEIYYSDSFRKKVQFPSSHVLNIPSNNRKKGLLLDPNFKLLNSMVHITNGAAVQDGKKRAHSKIKNKKWKRLRIFGMNMSEKIRERHKKTDYLRLLERHCNMHYKFKQNEKTQYKLQDLVTMFTPETKVFGFCKAVLRSTFPYPEFWGSEYNFNLFLKTLNSFLQLRKQDIFPMKAVTHGIHVLDMQWLTGGTSKKIPKSSHFACTSLAQNVFKWVFCDFIFPLLRNTFYITETEFTGNQMKYYRKPIWAKIRKLSIFSLTNSSSQQGIDCQYDEIDLETTRKFLRNKRLGCSKLKLLPKKTGIRFIVILSKRYCLKLNDDNASANVDIKTGAAYIAGVNRDTANPGKASIEKSNNLLPRERFISYAQNKQEAKQAKVSLRCENKASTNRILRNSFDVVKYECNRNPNIFGSGLRGQNEMHVKLKSLVPGVLHSSSSSKKNHVPLYFASVDIHRCYDNMNLCYLMDLVGDMLGDEEYLIQKFSVLYPYFSLNRLRRQEIHRVCPPENFQLFNSIAGKLSENYSESIFVDRVKSSVVKKEDVFDLILEHLKNHIVVTNGNFGPRFFLQKQGIPQGSILSTYLCNLYYGAVEDELMSGVFESKETISNDKDTQYSGRNKFHALFRIVDDFLFITTDKEACIRFLSKMHKGIPRCGVQINESKSKVNFDIETNNDNIKICPVENASIQQNYFTKGNKVEQTFFPWCGLLFNTHTCEVRIDYSRFTSTHARDSLKVEVGGKGIKLYQKMISFVRPRCIPILYDSQVNGKDVIMINFYQAMLYSAIKTVHLVRLSSICKSNTNPSFLFQRILDLVNYAHNLVRSKLRNSGQVEESGGNAFIMTKEETMPLGIHAFCAVCEKSNFHDIVGLLKTTLKERLFSKAITKRALSEFQLERFCLD